MGARDGAAVEELEWDDPCPDIHELFNYYNATYFDHELGACVVEWSSPRMTMCAGTCAFSEGSGCRIRLSEPLLKFRPSCDLKNTLLHEMIHASLFLSRNNRDRDDHGPHFRAIMHRINTSHAPDFFRPQQGYEIDVYHQFRDEVDNYRTHVWACSTCADIVKRAMNRTPSEKDCMTMRRASPAVDGGKCHDPRCAWHVHARFCGGEYVKVSEPEDYVDRRKRRAGDASTSSDASGGPTNKKGRTDPSLPHERSGIAKAGAGGGLTASPGKVKRITDFFHPAKEG